MRLRNVNPMIKKFNNQSSQPSLPSTPVTGSDSEDGEAPAKNLDLNNISEVSDDNSGNASKRNVKRPSHLNQLFVEEEKKDAGIPSGDWIPIQESFTIENGDFDYDLTELDTDEYEPVARMNFSSTFKNTRRHMFKPVPVSKI